MMIPSPVVLLTFLSVASFAAGEIRHYEIRSDDRPILLLDLFEFSNRDQLELNLTVLSRRPLRPDSDILSKMGFFLCTSEEWLKVLQQFEDSEITCVLESSPYVVYTFESLPTPITTKFDFLYPESKAGLYNLLFVNCNLGLRVSMNLRSSMYNLEAGESNRRDYLSANETALPGVYLMFAVIYLAMASIWFSISEKMILNRSGIHFLMLLVVVLKALNLLCDAKYKLYIKSTGYYSHGWFYVLFCTFSFLKDIIFFPVIILIGSGWPFLKPDLQGKVKKVLMIVIPLQMVANTAQLMIHKNEPYGADWIVWNQVWLLADTVCWFAVLFPIFWTIKNLRGAVRTANSDAKAELMNSHKGSLFRQYCFVVICYISFTKVVVPALKGVTSYECVESIAAAVSREFATMAFCVFTGYMVQAWYQDSA